MIVPTQSLRFDIVNIALSYIIHTITSGILLLIYFGKLKITSVFHAVAGDYLTVLLLSFKDLI